jgi:tetratricopeptide (TPR) repeat protein
MGRGLDFARERPGRFAALVAKRFGLFFTAGEIPQNESFDFMSARSQALRAAPFGFGIMAPLALVGTLLARRRGPGGRLPALMALAPLLAGMLFFVTGRFRLPAVPLLLPYAGLAVAAALDAARRRAWPGLLRGMAAAGAVAVIIHVIPPGFRRESAMALEYVHEGLRHEGRGEPGPAKGAFKRAIEADPSLAMAYHNLAAAEVRSGALARAIPLYEKAHELDPGNAWTLCNLGAVQGRVGNHRGAIGALEAAVALRPDWADALCDLGAAYANSGRLADAEGAWRRALRARPNDARAVEALRRIGVEP